MIRRVRNDIPGILPLLAELGHLCELEDLKTRFIKFLNNLRYGIAVCEMNIVGVVASSKSDLFVLDKVEFHIECLIISEYYGGASERN